MSEYIIDMSSSSYQSESGLLCADVSQLRDEIVRCRDCKWCVEADAFYDCKHFACHICWNEGQKPDGFCAWGIKK